MAVALAESRARAWDVQRGAQGAFKLEQTQVLLILEFAFLFATLLVWFAKRRDEAHVLDLQTPAKRPGDKRYGVNRRASKDLRETARAVPIPWGWPNCAGYRWRRGRLTASEALQLFADTLSAERQLVSAAANDPSFTASIRSQIEDRYHPAGRDAGQWEPALPEIPEDIWMLGPAAESRAAAGRQLRIAKQGVRELRRPWGW